MALLSAALLAYRCDRSVELLIVHPGGPFWAKKDDGAWSIPKGEYDAGDDPWLVALREFEEELGQPPPRDDPIDLGVLRQPSGKKVHCFAVEADLDIDVDVVVSNDFEMEWPPRSGRMQSFPEVDRAAWVTAEVARTKLLKGQVPFVDLLLDALR
jgi:predicted NUDIX family NTP pyrophosphohydrolase